MKAVYTQEQMDNMTLLAATVQKANPHIEPRDVSIGVVKLQKLASTLRGRNGQSISNELVRSDYEAVTRRHREKFAAVAKQLNVETGDAPEADKFGSVHLRVAGELQRVW